MGLVTKGDHAYVYINHLQKGRKNDYSIKVINLRDAKVTKEINIPNGGIINEMKIQGEKLFVPMGYPGKEKSELLIISLEKNKISKRINLNYKSPAHILFNNDNILITHNLSKDKGKISILNKQSLKVMKNIELSHSFFRVIKNEDNLYVLNQEGKGGVIYIYDLNNWNLQNTIHIDGIRNMKVQDFLLLK